MRLLQVDADVTLCRCLSILICMRMSSYVDACKVGAIRQNEEPRGYPGPITGVGSTVEWGTPSKNGGIGAQASAPSAYSP